MARNNKTAIKVTKVVTDTTSDSSCSPNNSTGYVTPDPESVTVGSLEATCLRQSPGHNITLAMVMEELRAMRSDLKLLRNDMEASLRTAMQSCNTRIDGLEARIHALEEHVFIGTTTTTSGTEGSINEVINNLKLELNDRDQELLANDIEVSNMPELNGENPLHIVKAIGVKLGVTVEDRDIVSAERVGGRHLVAVESTGTMERRARALVVRLARRDLRDQLMRAARVRRGTTTADMDMSGPPRKFFLNERLTKTNRQLFRKAREAARGAGWQYAWTKRGRIFVCNKPGSITHRICTEADICNVFGSV